jgi:hypothetical protein
MDNKSELHIISTGRYSGLYDESHWEDYPGQICPSQVVMATISPSQVVVIVVPAPCSGRYINEHYGCRVSAKEKCPNNNLGWNLAYSWWWVWGWWR